MLAIILLPPYDGYYCYYIYLLDEEVCAMIVSAMAPPRDKTLRLADDSFIDCYSMLVLLFFC